MYVIDMKIPFRGLQKKSCDSKTAYTNGSLPEKMRM